MEATSLTRVLPPAQRWALRFHVPAGSSLSSQLPPNPHRQAPPAATFLPHRLRPAWTLPDLDAAPEPSEAALPFASTPVNPPFPLREEVPGLRKKKACFRGAGTGAQMCTAVTNPCRPWLGPGGLGPGRTCLLGVVQDHRAVRLAGNSPGRENQADSRDSPVTSQSLR